MKTKIKKNYPYYAAGRTWSVPELRLVSLPDGTAAISEEEIHRIHRAIANEICGNNISLSMEELEFLCDVTGTTFSDVADWLQIHRSTVTRWRKSGEVPKSVMSLVLKKWFWYLLFGESLHDETIPLNCAVNETRFLSFAKQETIDKHLADPVSQAKIL
ncbi:MAG: helix-turn-helix domain-containing protein [Gemmatimonadota bacterium]|nr:helix-turn-helix domain-containing protein [Gemmatimonadota bacterium]